MGGKGRKRREKNYKAAHGGNNRLPPPPNPSSLDALPSKLRKLMSLSAAASTFGSGKASSENADKKKRTAGDAINRTHPSKDVDSMVNTFKGQGGDTNLMGQHMHHGSGALLDNTNEKRKKKRKRNQLNDLRFGGAEEVGGSGSQRKERKKQRLEERKKKSKKGRAADDVDFPGREEVKFGDVVEAPPKLVAVPKPLKNTQDASVERLRLQAVEDYRKRKGWTSRPGVQLRPPTTAVPPMLR